ncbi:MAG: hypothetical protein IJS46_03430, partial [Kiritimatiellae bacterium]|nr:hypothetical protein [Kiritimatiellia bacterium]
MQLRKNPKLLFAVFAAALAAAAMMPVQPCGETLFTGLDDSAQSILAKSICGGGSLVFKDSAFAAVPDGARRDLLYRPLAARKTRDLAHQIDAKSFTARPFFQPFFPLQRALLPGLPLILALATLYLLHSLAAPVGDNRPGPAARIAFACATVFALAFPTPWHSPHYLLGSYAEGPATLFAALAMALAFAPGGGARRGFAVGFALGASVAFHQTLAAYAIPIAAFSTMRSGRPRHFAALLAGLALPTAALVWSTLNIAAPYGNFLSRSTLRSMIAHSPDIAALARALAAAALPALVLAVCALSPRVRRFFASSRISTASTAVCAAATFAAIAVVLSLPNCRKGFTCDCGSIALAAPAMALSFAAAIARRRGAACALIAMCAWASVPFFAVQGNETHVGLWSMRRALTPVVLSSIALFGASLERSGGFPAKCRFAVPKRWRVCIVGAWCLCGACSVAATGARLAFVPRTGDKSLFKKIAAKIDCIRTESGAEPLVLFDSFRFGAPFAATMGGNAFCISDLVSRTADTSEISKWMLAEALRGRPVFVCATK